MRRPSTWNKKDAREVDVSGFSATEEIFPDDLLILSKAGESYRAEVRGYYVTSWRT